MNKPNWDETYVRYMQEHGAPHMAFRENPKTVYFFGMNEDAMIRLEANGDIYVKGKLVENDKEVVDGLREFVETLRKR